jgi:hypothetical protein
MHVYLVTYLHQQEVGRCIIEFSFRNNFRSAQIKYIHEKNGSLYH